MSWLKRLGESSKQNAAARVAAGKSRTGSKLKPKVGGGKLGGSLPSEIARATVQTRENGYTVVYSAKVNWFQSGSKKRKQKARRVIGLSKDEKSEHRAAAIKRFKSLGRRMGVFK